MRWPQSSFFVRLGLWAIAKLPFPSLPLLINAFIWVIVHKVTVWPLFKVEDLNYFAILVSGETAVGLLVQVRSRDVKPLLFLLPFLVTLGSAMLLGYWHHETANPDANMPFAPIVNMLVRRGKLLAIASLGGAILCLFYDEDGPETVPRPDVWLIGRMFVALIPCLASGFLAFLPPHQVFRVNDLCFFAIAVSGPAVIDLGRSRINFAFSRVIGSVPLITIIVFSSVILGSSYFASALPLEPVANRSLVLALLYSAMVCAGCAMVAACFVEWNAWRLTSSATQLTRATGGSA